MKLNIRAQTAQNQHNNSPIVLVHGLFGSLDNLGVLARDLVNDHNIIQVDMRNHGLSPREPVMNYPAMAQDLVDTLDALQIDKATFIGHSMGGKAVMALTALAPDRIDKLVAIDIAPVDYHVRRHDEIFAAINAVSESDAQTRQQAAAIMRQHLNEEGVIQFLLKSFVDGEWRFNVPVLWISIRILWVGRKSRHGITLPCLSLAAILRMLASSTVMIYWLNFHRHGRM